MCSAIGIGESPHIARNDHLGGNEGIRHVVGTRRHELHKAQVPHQGILCNIQFPGWIPGKHEFRRLERLHPAGIIQALQKGNLADFAEACHEKLPLLALRVVSDDKVRPCHDPPPVIVVR